MKIKKWKFRISDDYCTWEKEQTFVGTEEDFEEFRKIGEEESDLHFFQIKEETPSKRDLEMYTLWMEIGFQDC